MMSIQGDLRQLSDFPNYTKPIYHHYSVRDYHVGIDGKTAPKGAEWSDKPHRLVFDLCRVVLVQDQRISSLEAENKKLRALLAYSASAKGLYTDDGELQDNSVFPVIDFKRDSADQIETSMQERAKRGLTQTWPGEWQYSGQELVSSSYPFKLGLVNLSNVATLGSTYGQDGMADMFGTVMVNQLNSKQPLDMERLHNVVIQLEHCITQVKNASFDLGAHSTDEDGYSKDHEIMFARSTRAVQNLYHLIYSLLSTCPFALSHFVEDHRSADVKEFAKICMECATYQRPPDDWKAAVPALLERLSLPPAGLALESEAELKAFKALAKGNNYELGPEGNLGWPSTETQDLRYGWVSALIYAFSLFPGRHK